MINKAVLVGRLTRAVDLRFTSNGVAFASFTVAVDRTFKKEDGEREADFINCVMWRKAAENFSLLESRNVTEQRPENDNPFQKGFHVGNNQNNMAGTFGNNTAPTFENAGSYRSFNSNSNDSFGGSGNNQTMNISDDDLPF